MTEVLNLKKYEWLSLAAIALLLAVAIYALQVFTQKSLLIGGEPHFEAVIGKSELKYPMDVAVYKDKIAVTSSAGGNVKLYKTNQQLYKTIELEKGAYPASLAFNKNGILYIGDIENKVLYKSSALIGSSKAEKLKLKKAVKPLALAAINTRLVIFDGDSQKIKIMDSDLRVSDFSQDKDVKLNYSNGIANDGEYVYVSDSNGRSVLRFDQKGNFTGDRLTNFSLPRGIAVDKIGRLHIVDTFAHTIKVFNKEGRFLFNYGSEGSTSSKLYLPNSIAIDSSKGKIYIADKGNNQVKVWSW